MAQDKLAAIFAAAMELFSTRGFEKTTVDDIAAQAGRRDLARRPAGDPGAP